MNWFVILLASDIKVFCRSLKSEAILLADVFLQSVDSLSPLSSIVFFNISKISSGLSPVKFFKDATIWAKLGGTNTFSNVIYDGRLYWGSILSLPISAFVDDGLNLSKKVDTPSFTRLVNGRTYPFGNMGITGSLQEKLNIPLSPRFILLFKLSDTARSSSYDTKL